MNLATKIVIGEDQDQAFELTWRFCIKPISGSVYLKEVEHDNDTIVQIDF